MSSFFTETQWKELELQTLIFNYLVSGIPVPFHLIALLRRSFFFLDPYSLHPSMNFVRKVEDPEPWRCKRTDGKKWRCSKEAFSESKYCERHMHRGKKSSRKLVEHPTTPNTLATMNNNTTHLLLGSPSSIPSDKNHRYCHNFFSEATREERESPLGLKQRGYYDVEGDKKEEKHCYVLGTDLMLEKPVKSKLEEEPNPVLCLFRECGEESKTQLSISIP